MSIQPRANQSLEVMPVNDAAPPLGRKNETKGMNTFSLLECYTVAWRAFRKWWIPLCLISGSILIFEITPRIMIAAETEELRQAFRETSNPLMTAVMEQDLEKRDALVIELLEPLTLYLAGTLKWLALAAPFVAVLTIILLMWANAAVKDHRKRNTLGRTLYITVVHVLLSFVKMTAFLFFLIPGFFIYVRLLFVSLIMLEDETCGMWEAFRRSWAMTKGNFWPLLGLFVINSTCQIVMALTVIGVIPVTGFANTARAAAFQMLNGIALPLPQVKLSRN